ncbi:hypothetical protein [Symbiopectobacterium purcellii]|uniref:Uncharacterized protein n=1 Tax=Symbiopectobacterium purcellii TaxID=2871826 RepID=A0ABX9AQ19_9ENTR|nr:hypothetical protein [Symbiopectobacterium purcellii]QZN97267.1 hypothetical protein K6K13_07925 [Symbiopectobacterium purcellii]
MPKIPLINDQYRNVIGNYTNMQDGKYGSQRDQNERIKALASNPGLHSGNRDRKNVAQALVRLISLLNIVSNTAINTTRGIDNSQPTSLRSPGAGSAPYGVVPTVGIVESYEPSLLPVTAVTPIDDLFKRINFDAVKGIKRSVNDRKLNHSKNKKMIHFLKRNKVLAHGLKIPSVSKELLLSGAAHWIYDSDIQENITPLHRVEDIAKCILSEFGEYGSKKREKLSHHYIEKVVAQWMFNAILGVSLNEYLISKIETHSDGIPLTIGEIKNLLKLGTLSDSEVFNMNNVPVEWRSDLVEMWSSLLKNTFPAIYLDDENINDVPIDSEVFSHLYAGARFLKDVGQLHGVSRENILSVG